jgi:hypothetical protein
VEKLATEAPVNGGRNYNNCMDLSVVKRRRSVVVIKSGYMLETPVNLALLASHSEAVTM